MGARVEGRFNEPSVRSHQVLQLALKGLMSAEHPESVQRCVSSTGNNSRSAFRYIFQTEGRRGGLSAHLPGLRKLALGQVRATSGPVSSALGPCAVPEGLGNGGGWSPSQYSGWGAVREKLLAAHKVDP